LARLLDPEELGLFGLLAATIGYALFLVGFDFYIYTTREVIRHKRSSWGSLLKNQWALFVVSYILFIPLIMLVFWLGLLPWYVAPWFFTLLFLEHSNQEVARFLIAVSCPMTASWVLFLRSGLWVVGLAVAMLIEDENQTVLTVLKFWSVGGFLALLLGITSILRLNVAGWRRSIDWIWVLKGLKISIPFLFATLSIRGIYTADRFWFETLAGIEVLAVYVLFIGIAGILGSFLEALIFVYQYPVLIRFWQEQSPAAFCRESLRMLTQTIYFSAIFSFLAIACLPFLVSWLDRPIYAQYQELFPYLMFAMVLYSLSMVPHYMLYAQGRDRAIIWSHFVALFCFVLAVWIQPGWNSLLAVPVALCVAFAALLVWKFAAYLVLTPLPYRIFTSANRKA
jgi:O-antigen/teichoic acid export membrane protein